MKAIILNFQSSNLSKGGSPFDLAIIQFMGDPPLMIVVQVEF
jgi:hypothetical protein